MLDLLSMVSVARSVRPRAMTGSPEVVARQRTGPYDDFERPHLLFGQPGGVTSADRPAARVAGRDLDTGDFFHADDRRRRLLAQRFSRRP